VVDGSRASLVVDGSTSVDKKMPPGFLVVDGAAAALLPPPLPPPPPLGLGPLMEKEGDVFSSNGCIATWRFWLLRGVSFSCRLCHYDGSFFLVLIVVRLRIVCMQLLNCELWLILVRLVLQGLH
jgi:hypothetical protein